MYFLTCLYDAIADTYQVTCKIQGIFLAFYKYSRLEPVQVVGYRLTIGSKVILEYQLWLL